MKRLTAALAAAALLCTGAAAEAPPAPEVSARSAVLMHADTGEILCAKNALEPMLIASTTKLMTALTVLDVCEPGDEVDITPEMCGVEGSSMYLRAGESCTVEELLCGLLLVSGNDAATALALHAAGSMERFAELMNDKARELGMAGSHFENAHGLDAEGHHSTARDLAVLMAACMSEPLLAEITGAARLDAAGRTLVNHNRLLREYDGCIGVKTGYTKAAGRCLVSCAEREGTRFICVTLDAPDDWADHAALYDWAFANYSYETVISPETVLRLPAATGSNGWVEVSPQSEARVLLPSGSVAALETHVELPPFVFAPVEAGETLGEISVSLEGEVIALSGLVCSSGAQLPRETLLQRLGRALGFAWKAGPYYLTDE